MPRPRKQSGNPGPGTAAEATAVLDPVSPEQSGPKFNVRVEQADNKSVEDDGRPELSKSLFPDFVGKDGGLLKLPPMEDDAPEKEQEEPKPEEPKATPEEKPAEPEKKEPEKTPEPAPADVLDVSMLAGKKVRIKVDGVEMEVPADQVVNNYQLKMYLDKRGQRLNEQERAIREQQERARDMAARKQKPASDDDGDVMPEDSRGEDEAPEYVKSLKRDLDETKRALAEVSRFAAKARYEDGINEIHNRVKESLGFDDFKSYVPKIKEFVLSQVRDPNNITQQEVAMYDTADFFVQKYQEMKLRELNAAAQPKPVAPVASPQTPASSAKRVNIVDIEGASGGKPSGESSGWAQRYRKALARATETQSSQDWAEVMRLKRESPDGEE